MEAKKRRGRASSFRLDLDAESVGVWSEFEGIDFLHRPWMNPDHKDRARELAAERGLLDADGTVPEAALDRSDAWLAIMLESANGTVLLNWRNWEAEDETGEPSGEDFDHTPERALEVLRDERYRLFHEWLVKVASNEKRYTERAVGNSSQ